MRIGIVAGEESGDILGAGLMASLKRRFPACQFEGIGGERMLAEGFESFFPQDRLAVMGLVEPLKRLPELLRIRRFLRKHFLANPPAVFIGIDSPDFNLDLEVSLRSCGIKTVHYVSPSVWAWRQKRVIKIARAVDLMLTLFPFEEAFYKDHKVPVRFVGHPLADQIEMNPDQAAAQRQLNVHEQVVGKRVVALLPGSRGNEVERLGPVFLESARWCKARASDLAFLIPAANRSRLEQLKILVGQFPDLDIQLFLGQSHSVMAASDVVVMASGTTTLEALLLKRPMVIAYSMAEFSFFILSRLVKVSSIGLPNLLAQRKLVPEFIQSAAKPELIGQAVLEYLESADKVVELKKAFGEIHHQLRRDASETAAAAIAELIEGNTQ